MNRLASLFLTLWAVATGLCFVFVLSLPAGVFIVALLRLLGLDAPLVPTTAALAALAGGALFVVLLASGGRDGGGGDVCRPTPRPAPPSRPETAPDAPPFELVVPETGEVLITAGTSARLAARPTPPN